MKLVSILTALLAVLLIGCTQPSDFHQAMNQINENDYRKMVSILGSDTFEGRLPGSAGEQKTVAYLESEFKKLGLIPAFNGSYFQEVPLIGFTCQLTQNALIKNEKGNFELIKDKDIIVSSTTKSESINLSQRELVFVGYGISAPHLGWDDYKNVDVKNKIVITFLGTPKNNSNFNAPATRSYSRRGYKFLEAARHQAAGIILIHIDKEIGYPFVNSKKKSESVNFYSPEMLAKNPHCDFEGIIPFEIALKMFHHLGFDLPALMAESDKSDFIPVPLKATFDAHIACSHRELTSKNVGALYEGSSHKDECIVFTAHWDHLGITGPIDGDSIVNGAVDNGTTIAWMFGIAKAFTSLKVKPKRSLLFLSPTAEESGLLGTYYYCANPVFKMENTVACFNNDLMIPMGRMKDVMITGYGYSDLDALVEEAAKKQDRYVCDDTHPERGMFFRSDHFPFAVMGVPVMYGRGNSDSRKHGKQWADSVELKYIMSIYHHPADNYDEKNWDVEGLLEDTRLFFDVSYQLSNQTNFPQWNDNAPYKAIRNAQGR